MDVLDLFCGAGGASMGLHKAGFNVTGMDIELQPEYPFPHQTKDVFDKTVTVEFLKSFDLIWASPPCQCYSWSARKSKNLGKHYPDLIDKSRDLLIKTKKPFIIENVCSAPIKKDLMLCGIMFDLKVIKHRYFEIHGFTVEQLPHIKHNGTVKDGSYVTVAGHGGDGKASLKAWQNAMGINWITDKHMLAEAIPPAYGEYIGKQFKKTSPIPLTDKSVSILGGIL